MPSATKGIGGSYGFPLDNKSKTVGVEIRTILFAKGYFVDLGK